MFFPQERAFGELEKNSDKLQSSIAHKQSDPPSHFHRLLSAMHRHLLAHCYTNSEAKVRPADHCKLLYNTGLCIFLIFNLPRIICLFINKLGICAFFPLG